MKKNVVLLLALVVMLSALPMYVFFGQVSRVPGNPVIVRAGTYRHGEGPGGALDYLVPLQFNIGAVLGIHHNEAFIRVQLTGNDSYFFFDAELLTQQHAMQAELRSIDNHQTIITVALVEGENIYTGLNTVSRTWFDSHIGTYATPATDDAVEIKVFNISDDNRAMILRLNFPDSNPFLPHDVRGNVQILLPVRVVNDATDGRPAVSMSARMVGMIGGAYQIIFDLDNTRLDPPRLDHQSLTVGTQQGTIYVGDSTEVTFPFASAGIPIGNTFNISVSGLPDGVTLHPSHRAITIGGSGNGQLHLAGSSNTMAGTWDNLRLNLYRDGHVFMTSNLFSITIDAPPQEPEVPLEPSTPENITIPAVEGAVDVEIYQSGNVVTLQLPARVVDTIIDKAEGVVTFNLSEIEDATAVTIPRAAWSRFAENALDIELVMPEGTLSFDNSSVASISGQTRAPNISVSMQLITANDISQIQRNAITPDGQLFTISLESGGRNMTEFDGKLSVTVPYNVYPPVFVQYIGSDGSVELLPVEYNVVAGTVTFATSRLAVFMVGGYVAAEEAPATQVAIMRLTIGRTSFTSHGQLLVSDVAPFIDTTYDRTMVPLRIVADALGAEVRNDSDTNTVYITHNGQEILLPINVPLPDEMGTPVIINNRTFVPIRYVVEVLGARVSWDGPARTVSVYMN